MSLFLCVIYYTMLKKAPDNQAKTDSQEFSYDQPDVFDRLFDRHYTSLWSFAFHYVKDKDIAEDLVQEAFIQLWDHLKGFDSFAAIRVYLFRNVRNAALDYLRHDKVRNRNRTELNVWLQNELREPLERKIIEEEVFGSMYDAIYKLPEQTRKIVLLTLEGVSNPKIAEQLKISVNTLKTLKKRAYQYLRNELGPYRFTLLNWIFLLRKLIKRNNN